MKRSEVLAAIEDAAALPAGSLQGDEVLASLAGWDSLTGVAFRVAVQKKWNVPLSGIALSRCETVADIMGLLGSHVADR